MLAVGLARGSGSFGEAEVCRLVKSLAKLRTSKSSHYLAIELGLGSWCARLAQINEVAEPDVFIVCDLIGFKSGFDFAHTAFQIVPAAEAKDFFGLVEAHTIIAAVGILDKFCAGLRKHAKDDLGHFGKGVVQAVVADIEDLSTDCTERRIENVDHGFGQILHVHKRPPLLAIENGNRAILIGPRGK